MTKVPIKTDTHNPQMGTFGFITDSVRLELGATLSNYQLITTISHRTEKETRPAPLRC